MYGSAPGQVEGTGTADPAIGYAVDIDAFVLAPAVEETDTVAVVKLAHVGDDLAHGLGRAQRSHAAGTSSGKKIVGKAAVEALVELRVESDFGSSAGSAPISVGIGGDDPVELLPIVGRYIFYIRSILKAAFYFER